MTAPESAAWANFHVDDSDNGPNRASKQDIVDLEIEIALALVAAAQSSAKVTEFAAVETLISSEMWAEVLVVSMRGMRDSASATTLLIPKT